MGAGKGAGAGHGLWILSCRRLSTCTGLVGMPRRAEPDPTLPALTLLSQASDAGLTRHQTRQRVRSGQWRQVARGAYLPEGEKVFEGLDTHARARVEHIQRAVAAASRNPGTVVTDASAALVHGLPVLQIPPNVQLGVPPGRWSGTRSGIDFRIRDFNDDDIRAQRVPVASPWRAWVDITRYGSLADALACGDFAMRTGLFESFSATDLEVWRGKRGYRRLCRALPLLDGVRESPLESASFAYFVEHRLPLPLMQCEVRSRFGAFIARVDFWWPSARLVGEADGAVKYAHREDLYAEKRREDAIRAEGLRVLRWSVGDLHSAALAHRIRRHVG